ncbi:hypothetical protein [Vibrio phage S4-7]|nr:hypothetical protein [Vibrio phage S4-7]
MSTIHNRLCSDKVANLTPLIKLLYIAAKTRLYLHLQLNGQMPAVSSRLTLHNSRYTFSINILSFARYCLRESSTELDRLQSNISA